MLHLSLVGSILLHSFLLLHLGDPHIVLVLSLHLLSFLLLVDNLSFPFLFLPLELVLLSFLLFLPVFLLLLHQGLHLQLLLLEPLPLLLQVLLSRSGWVRVSVCLFLTLNLDQFVGEDLDFLVVQDGVRKLCDSFSLGQKLLDSFLNYWLFCTNMKKYVGFIGCWVSCWGPGSASRKSIL